MMARRNFGGGYLRAAVIVGTLLPFLLVLFLLPEPTDSELEDYLPSSRARTLTAKIIKSLKSFQGECSGAAGGDVAAGGQRQAITIFQASIAAELNLQLRHFALLTNRLVRSPPANSL